MIYNYAISKWGSSELDLVDSGASWCHPGHWFCPPLCSSPGWLHPQAEDGPNVPGSTPRHNSSRGERWFSSCISFMETLPTDVLLYPVSTHFAFPVFPQLPTRITLCFWIYLLWTFHINDIVQYVAFCTLLLLSIMFSGFIHAVASMSTSFTFIIE